MGFNAELKKNNLEAVVTFESAIDDVDAVAKDIAEQFNAKGVQPALDAGAVKKVLEGVKDDPEALSKGVVVASGTPPTEGIKAEVKIHFPVKDTPLKEKQHPFVVYKDNVVYPGDALLVKKRATKGIEGLSLLGDALPASDGADIKVNSAENVFLDDDGETYRANGYGVVLFNKGRLQVVSAMDVSEDRMWAKMVVFPEKGQDQDRVYQRILGALKELGVTNGIQSEAIIKAISQAIATNKPVGKITCALAKKPVDGRESDYKLLFDTEKKVGEELEGGRIDFREADTVKNITAGEKLAEIIPAQEPVSGFRIDGVELEPEIHKATGYVPGEHTRPSEDGAFIVADIDGILSFRGGQFHISGKYTVKGDVDYSTGNIRATGDVKVVGMIKPGFKVEAEGEVEVQKDLEEAAIEAGGDVQIHGGVTNDSVVMSQKGVTLRYLQNSTVEAEGDVDAKLSITNSKVYTKGKIIAMGPKGQVSGGEINAAHGIEVKILGSPTASTKVAVGVDMRIIEELEVIEKERKKMEDELLTLQKNIGKQFLKDPQAALAAIPTPLRKTKLTMLQRMKELFTKSQEMKARREELLEANRDLKDAMITVHQELHPGTKIRICSASVEIAKPMRRVTLYYDSPNSKVGWRKA